MSAIDELCRMLDECGVEYEGGERSLRWRDRYGIMMQAFPLANGELGMGVWSCTPEQAIAATLGRGTLSASQVSNAVYAHSIHADCADADWQAIADELNATLGRGECHNLKASWPSLFECDECGYSNDDTYCGSECHFKFCPNCGAKVVGA